MDVSTLKKKEKENRPLTFGLTWCDWQGLTLVLDSVLARLPSVVT